MPASRAAQNPLQAVRFAAPGEWRARAIVLDSNKDYFRVQFPPSGL